MSVRTKAGRLRLVTGAQTVSEGRASRAQDAGQLAHRPTMSGLEGAVASLAESITEVVFGVDGALNRMRHGRKRLRRLVGADEARRVEAVLRSGGGLDLVALASADKSARPRVLRGAVETASIAREYGVDSTAALASLAVSGRCRALGHALLDQGIKDLDSDKLKLATTLFSAARLEQLNALELHRSPCTPTCRCSGDEDDQGDHHRRHAGRGSDDPDHRLDAPALAAPLALRVQVEDLGHRHRRPQVLAGRLPAGQLLEHAPLVWGPHRSEHAGGRPAPSPVDPRLPGPAHVGLLLYLDGDAARRASRTRPVFVRARGCRPSLPAGSHPG